jgi:hypothetical protein
LRQEGFRWREDDGDEDGASWIDTQDTNIVRLSEVNTRLRIVIDGTFVPGLNFSIDSNSQYEALL